MHRLTSAALVAVMLAGVGAAIAHNLDGCLSMVREDGTRPTCCALAGVDRVKRDRYDCCEDPLLSDFDPSSAPSDAPSVPRHSPTFVPIRALASVAPAGLAPRMAAARDRPPDLQPPTATTVLLI